ncbi:MULTISPECIES: hypothetical protein [unclassified Actinoplanes]|uniref:hypothetical protein n=1 Tax=unclassified Actinoplanes TaxID=2626549 RepID=UPI00043A3098|nr:MULTISPECIES: hypothetical protein [unclassified Actinoplanes]
MRSMVLAGLIPAVLVPGAAQASPCPTTDVLGTYAFGRAATIGAAGETAGVWTVAGTRSGIAGDDLIVTYTPRYTAAATETAVYTALFNQVARPDVECDRVGADGVAKHVWVTYRCRTGVAPNYTLLVR